MSHAETTLLASDASCNVMTARELQSLKSLEATESESQRRELSNSLYNAKI